MTAGLVDATPLSGRWEEWPPDVKRRLLDMLKYEWASCRPHSCYSGTGPVNCDGAPAATTVCSGDPPGLAHDRYWRRHARPEQLTPPGAWNIHLVLAGRGAGKTRQGAEDIKKYVLANPGAQVAVVAPTFGDGRDTCIEGVSGLRAVLPPGSITAWNRSLGQLSLTNGSMIRLFSAEEPDRLRGPNFHRAWADELAAWSYPEAWDQLMFALRLGDNPQVVVTTTPRPTELIRDLSGRDDGTVHLTRGSTFNNAANLAPAALAELQHRYGQTTLGRQELYGEIVEGLDGALWNRAQLDAARVSAHPDLVRVVVAIDPAVSNSPDSANETGLVAIGLGVDGHAYVLADRSCHLLPDEWTRRAVATFYEFSAKTKKTGYGLGQRDLIVAEQNQGYGLLEKALRSVPTTAPLPYKAVTARATKYQRGLDIFGFYEQGRVHHVGLFPELEQQMCSFTPDTTWSPDRLDALVWGLHELLLGSRPARARFVA